MGGQVSAASSFRNLRCGNANADWMSGLCPQLWDVPLHHLSIPGPAEWGLPSRLPTSFSMRGLVLKCNMEQDKETGKGPNGVSFKGGHNQRVQVLDVTEQLDAGVRYLDLRIAHALEGSAKNLHFVHMMYTTALVEVWLGPGDGGMSSSCSAGRDAARTFAQVLDVTEQLDAGVRYLDLRIAHAPEGSASNLHFVHMMYTTALVEDTLTEISEWLEKHPREVVLLACRNFQGLSTDLHEYLVTCIQNIFGDMLCPRGEVPTLRQLWAQRQQVIIFYEDEDTVSRHRELWPGVPYWWGNKVKVQELIRYLEDMKSCGRPAAGLRLQGANASAPY
ncbi:PREDICTED: PI-PLC X domain-containing protein 1-like [Galeopterus variegatus]|uniref:PI-PLC X domain-containing protein 1-like n=1 Tax=Galeopterus variegatus TaxID=482537 RepID=A0ABM0S940_GALVR|nr:PREDICTED: PI-PLC X domain-containing protein 1-like [Galeopterus variegatus]